VKKSFDYSVLFFIALNCITLAMERPSIPSISLVRFLLIKKQYKQNLFRLGTPIFEYYKLYIHSYI
jgi:hypothetical protein